jgi:protease II
MNKINTFTDFIASAEHLIAQKYTSANHLVIEGQRRQHADGSRCQHAP